MKRNSFLAVIGLILSFSCRKDFVFPEPSLEPLLGTWRWEQSSGGFAGISTNRTSNPDQAHTFEFKSNGICIERNNKDKTKFRFDIEKRSSIFSQGESWQLQLTEHGHSIGLTTIPSTISFISKDSLLLSDECHDCSIRLYTRQAD